MTNQVDGLLLGMTAEVRIVDPAATIPAGQRGEKLDIALVYTIPVMVNGRPT